MIDERRFAGLASAVARLERKVDFLFKALNIQYVEANLPFQAELEGFLEEGDRVRAIKLVREELDIGLQEAQALVDQVENQLRNQVSP